MKKLCCLILFTVMLFASVSALAEIDLTGMTYDELIALKDKINLAIWNSKEWQEVTVPQGEWIVGKDIPAGTWRVTALDDEDSNFCSIEWGFLDKNNDIDITSSNGGGYATLHNPKFRFYEEGDLTEKEIELKDGMVFKVDDSFKPAVFTTPTGKPSLGFK